MMRRKWQTGQLSKRELSLMVLLLSKIHGPQNKQEPLGITSQNLSELLFIGTVE